MIPQPITLNGRTGTIVYLDAQWHPVTPEQATMAKVVFDDGGVAFYVTDTTVKKFDEGEHPRDNEGKFTFLHGTTGERLQSILKQGLLTGHSGEIWPHFSDRSRVYMTTSEDDALRWAEGAVRQEAYGSPEALQDRPPDRPIAILTIRVPKEYQDQIYRDSHFEGELSNPARQFKGNIPPSWIIGAKIGVRSDEGWEDYKWKKVRIKKEDGQILYVVVVLDEEKPEGLGGITRKFDAAQHPRGHDGRFIEATEPRIFNRPSELMESKGWGGDPVRFVWKDPKTGESTGRLLTGEPIARETLPETLYHVTTNAPAVEASGVLLGLLEDGGLGGGQAPGVSMTSSKEAATLIQRELRRAIEIARGEATVDVVDRWAKEDEKEAGLPEGSLASVVREARLTWDTNTTNLDRTFVWDKNLPEEQRGWVGPAPAPAERERLRRSLLKDVQTSYLWARDSAVERLLGKRSLLMQNPILFGKQEHLAKLRPEDVQTLEIPSAQIPEGALITTGSDTFLHEVRTYSDVPLRKKLQSISKFEETQHPREEKGTPEGGQFKSSGASSDPALAEQAKAGIAAVEKLLPQALATTIVSGSLTFTSWWDVDPATQEAVKATWLELSQKEMLGESAEDKLAFLQKKWKQIPDEERFNLLSNFVDSGHITLTRDKVEPEQWVTGVETGEKGEADYDRTHALALRLTELRTEELRKERGLLEPVPKPIYTIHEEPIDPDEYVGFGGTGYVVRDSQGEVILRAYTHDQAQVDAESWAAQESERGKVSTKELIQDVWKSWKQKSSEGFGLSLQLAAANELGGHHRMTPEEVDEAIRFSRAHGGMPTLQAYVRAQWEVTQMIMAKAGAQKLDVYRAIMLPGEVVDKTSHQFVDHAGKPLPPPSNIQEHDEPNALVTFDFAGEHFSERRERLNPPKSILDLAKEGSTYEEMMAYHKAHPYEPVETTVRRRIEKWVKSYPEASGYVTSNIAMRLPELQLKRAGAQSTTGTRSVANDWGGVGDLPDNPTRVVLRIEAPPTSVLSLPVYGQNSQEEHESVLIGTKDHWLWDAWRGKAPHFESTHGITHKADTQSLVIDLQAEDRGKPHWLSSVNWATVQKFDEAEHPREPGGQPTGGQFTASGHAGEATPDPALAEQAKTGVAAIEKLIPEAVKTASYKQVADPESWDDVDQDTKNEVRDKWEEDQYGNQEIDTSDLDKETKEEVQKENQKILDKAVENTTKALKDRFKDLDPTLPIEGLAPYEHFDLFHRLDPESIDYGYGDHEDDDTVKLDLEALRFTSGAPLTDAQQQVVKQQWDLEYYKAYDEELHAAFESNAYMEKRSEMESEAINEAWNDLSDGDKYDFMVNEGLARGPKKTLPPKAPNQWVTGVETGTHQDEDYTRTHAIAQRLTILRTDELRQERGLVGTRPGEPPTYTIQRKDLVGGVPYYQAIDETGRVVATGMTEFIATAGADRWVKERQDQPSVTSENIIDRVWSDWKSSSSSGMSLSLQLAAAREFNGVHRMTPAEVAQAEYDAKPYGGIETLQAYVRAQWEVTQTIMAKAKEDKMQVYRAIYLPGEEVKKTAQVRMDKLGGPIPGSKPTNVVASVNKVNNAPIVAFDYEGQHFVVEKHHISKPIKSSDPSEETGAWESVLETDEAAVQRRINDYHTAQHPTDQIFTKLPELQLKRAGAQSTTGTRRVANDWGGVGNLPPDPVRVVIRVETPPTSVLSLPVYGQNVTEEHESVLIGTKDHWLWDAWMNRAPEFGSQPVSSTTRKAETKPLVVDLQAEDRGKPHWMSSVNWSIVLKWDASQHPRTPKGTEAGGEFTRVAMTSQRPVGDPEHKTNKQVFRHMREFHAQLEALPGVSNVSVKPGVGGWEGGSESMWQIYYKGNGEARKLVARTAKAFHQDGVLILNKCAGTNCQPAVELTFAGGVSLATREHIHQTLVGHGIGGWTWMKRDGKTVLRMVCVPQWGGEAAKHQQATVAISQELREGGLSNHRRVRKVAVEVMEGEGVHSYDSVIGA